MKKFLTIFGFFALFFLVYFILSNFSFAEDYTISVQNPTSNEDITDFFQSVMSRLQNIIAILAILFMVIGGILYLTSAGNENRAKLGKASFSAALIGFVLALAAPSFLKEIKSIIYSGGEIAQKIEDAPSLAEIALNTLDFLLSIFGTLALISFIISGIVYIFSLGNPSQANSAKKAFFYSLIGILAAAGSLIVVKQIVRFFG